MRTFAVSVLFVISAALLTLRLGAAAPSGATLYGLSAPDIDGHAVPLARYKGKVVLLVNTASQCGFTPQYEGLEKLYTTYKTRGFEVLGFPSNDFGGQEPGSSAEIKHFCSATYHVTFPLFAKVRVLDGPQQSPVYRWLSTSGHLPAWNFGKYLIGRDGHIIQFFDSSTRPDDATLRAAIEKALTL